MLNIVLFEPEIAPNTGNIIRLCANAGAKLNLVGKLGFDWDDKKLRRAGLDYHEWADVAHWCNYDDYLSQTAADRIFAFTTKAQKHYDQAQYRAGDTLLFGPETRGLPSELLNTLSDAQRLRLPMVNESRSLNLSNSVAIACYEAWRQLGFDGAASKQG